MSNPKTELVPAQSQALAVPSFVDRDDLSGKTGIDASSITLPRLAIAQGLSPEMSPDGSAYIDGLKMYDLFNNLTQEIYGRGPIRFLPIKRRVVFVEFDPQDRNVVLDRDVPAGDPRTKWRANPDNPKKGLPPLATEYVEFIVLLVREGYAPEPIVLSIKCTNKWNRKAADRLTMFILSTPGPSFASFKTVESKSEKNDEGVFGVYVIKNAGMMTDTPENQKLYQFAKQFSASVENVVIEVQREAGSDDDFDPATLEGDTAGM